MQDNAGNKQRGTFMMKIIAFDFDGTIADTIPICIKAFCESVSPYTDHELTEKEVVQTFGLNEIGMVKAVIENNWEQALCDFYEKYKVMHHTITEPFPGIRSLLSWLRENKIPTMLITGKGETSCTISLKELNLENTFDEILCGSEKAPNKAENIKYLLDKYSVSQDNFYYIGDTKKDVLACQEAGVTCLSAAWQDSSRNDVLEKENPGLVFYSVSQLHQYLSCK